MLDRQSWLIRSWHTRFLESIPTASGAVGRRQRRTRIQCAVSESRVHRIRGPNLSWVGGSSGCSCGGSVKLVLCEHGHGPLVRVPDLLRSGKCNVVPSIAGFIVCRDGGCLLFLGMIIQIRFNLRGRGGGDGGVMKLALVRHRSAVQCVKGVQRYLRIMSIALSIARFGPISLTRQWMRPLNMEIKRIFNICT